MKKTKKVFEWCLKIGKKSDQKHRGLRKMQPNSSKAKQHIEKALHNLKAMEYNIKGGFVDWGASAAFYAMYHSLLAILNIMGYESRNQECTINAVEYFILQNRIDLTTEDIKAVRNAQKLESQDAKTLRENMQYGTETSLEKEKLAKLREDAKYFVNKSRIALKTVGQED